jgi:adenylate kinase family enzyme
MKVSYDKWYPVVQPRGLVQQEVFIKKVDKQNAERDNQVQVDNRIKKFHQYEYEIYQYRMRQVTLDIQINNLKRDIDLLV